MNFLLRAPQLSIAVISLLFFIPFLGTTPLFDWDEINFAECAREMIESGNYNTVQINYTPFWEKPPLFIWMQAASMKIFGVNEFSARFPNVICGVLTLLLLYRAGKKLFSEKFGLIWVVAYGCSLLPHMYFKSGIIDPWFNLFIFSSFYFYFLGYDAIQSEQRNTSNYYFLLSGTALGLAVMTKGPVAIIIAVICLFVFMVFKRFKKVASLQGISLLILFTALIGGTWFLMLWISGNGNVINEFIEYQQRLAKTEDSGHGGPFYYHAVVLLIGCFPMSIIAIKGFLTKEKSPFKLWMGILFWVTLIIFSIVKTKIVHYSSLCYFPLSFMAALGLHSILADKSQKTIYYKSGLLTMGAIFGIALTAIPFIMPSVVELAKSGEIKDVFAAANLQADVSWSFIHALPGIMMLLGVILAGYFFLKNNFGKGYFSIATGMAFTLLFAAALVTPRIEKYSQHAAIEFYQEHAGENVYVVTYGYKSYAHLFYSKVKPYDTHTPDLSFVLSDALDKKSYIVSKINHREEVLSKYPDIKLLYEKNGFVFYEKYPVSGK